MTAFNNSLIMGQVGNSSGDSGWRELRADKSTRAINTIDYVHHEIHDGKAFLNVQFFTLGAGEDRGTLIRTSGVESRSHLTFSVSANAELNVKFYCESSGPADGGAGTQLSGVNYRRDSANTATTSIWTNPTLTDVSGYLVLEEQIGEATGPQSSNIGGDFSSRTEFVLASGSNYLISVTAVGAGTDVGIHLEWYEHTDKDVPDGVFT